MPVVKQKDYNPKEKRLLNHTHQPQQRGKQLQQTKVQHASNASFFIINKSLLK